MADDASAQLLPWEDVCGQLKAEFDANFRVPKADIVSHGGKRLVEHVTVVGLPQLGWSSHASVGNGHVNVAAVVGCELPRTADLKARKLVRGGIEVETYRCCQIIEQVLRACLADFADLVRLTVHVPSLTDAKVDSLEQALALFCQERGCPSVARSVVGCARLRLSASVQIEAVAVTNFRQEAGEADICPMLSRPPSCSPSPMVLSRGPDDRGAAASPLVPPPPGLLSMAEGRFTSPAIPSQGLYPELRGHQSRHLEQPVEEPFSSLIMGVSLQEAELESAPAECPEDRASSVETSSPPRLPASSAASTTTSPQQGQDESTHEKELGEYAAPMASLVEDPPVAPAEEEKAAPATRNPAVPKATQNERQPRKKGRAGKDAAAAAAKDAAAAAAAATIAAPRKEPVAHACEWQATPLNPAASRFVSALPQAAKPQRDMIPVEARPRSDTAQADKAKDLRPFVGHGQSLRLEEVSTDKTSCPRAEHLDPNLAAWRVLMAGADAYRTVRLGPSALHCQQLLDTSWAAKAKGPWPVTWSYEFDVTLAKTAMSFINIGLVEWTQQAKEPNADVLLGRAGKPPSLTQLMGVSVADEWDSDPAWQSVSENPRQLMLGCRKGVKWYGNNKTEPLFKDDLCEGTTLRFRCDHVFDASGKAKQMKFWLLPSWVVFRKQSPKMVELAKPLFEWPSPHIWQDLAKVETRTMWVPAATLFTKSDAVVFSWGAANVTSSLADSQPVPGP